MRRIACSLLLVAIVVGGNGLTQPSALALGEGALSGMGRPSHGVINGRLLAEVQRMQRDWRRAVHGRQSAPLVRLEVTSSRDVAGAIRSLGGKVEADVGGKVTAAEVPADRVADLARQAGVVTVFPTEKFHTELDQSVPEIRANQVWTLTDQHNLPIQGRHVLIGFVDSGIDYRNPDFRNPDGSTRIKYIWDQTQSGKPPAGYDFGYECDSASIDSGQCPERDTDGHGTHVAGIAAGNGLSSNPAREIGVAPQADIIVVKTDLQDDRIVAGWKYLVDKARQLNEPIVINNSFGNQQGPHDGSEPTSQAIDQLAGPGRIFVKSAGNDGDQGVHIHGTAVEGGTELIPIMPSGSATGTNQRTRIVLALYYSAQDSMGFTVTNLSNGETFNGFDQFGATLVSKDESTSVSFSPSTWDTTRREVDISVQSLKGKELSGQYTLGIKGERISGNGQFDGWMLQEGFGTFVDADESDTLSIPADAHNVITVGDYATRTSWVDEKNVQHNVCERVACVNGTMAVGEIEAHTSAGPTADGRQKPDIVAPGTVIISSLSADASIVPDLITPDKKNFVLAGTSMSSAHVAGVAALLLQVNPSLDGNGIGALLRSTARHDQFTGSSAWSPTSGSGKVDAYAAVQTEMTASRPTPTPTSTLPPRSTGKVTTKPSKRKSCKKGYKLVRGKCKKKHP